MQFSKVRANSITLGKVVQRFVLKYSKHSVKFINSLANVGVAVYLINSSPFAVFVKVQPVKFIPRIDTPFVSNRVTKSSIHEFVKFNVDMLPFALNNVPHA